LPERLPLHDVCHGQSQPDAVQAPRVRICGAMTGRWALWAIKSAGRKVP
jgi:hypothetical protein